MNMPTPEKGHLIHMSPLKSVYDINETVTFHCYDNRSFMVYGPSSARCTQNGWEYDGPSVPVCGCKLDEIL